MGTGKIILIVNEKGVTYRRQLKNISRPQLADLIVAIECLRDELKDKYKGTRTEIKIE